MTKHIATIAAFAVAVLLVLYGTFSFVGWELNPANWYPGGRLFLVLFWVGTVLPITGYYLETKT